MIALKERDLPEKVIQMQKPGPNNLNQIMNKDRKHNGYRLILAPSEDSRLRSMEQGDHSPTMEEGWEYEIIQRSSVGC